MDDQTLIVTTFILLFFWFNNSIKSTVSQPSLPSCPLEFKNITTIPLNSTCEEGTWDDFLRDKCCKEPFNIYLDALALHVNQTGKIYLNVTQQTSCLKRIKSNITNVFSCGIDKLNNGINGCSRFSVEDVLEELSDEVAGLSSGCDLLGHSSGGGGDDWNRSCEYCVQSWQKIKGIEPGDSDADLCRFAVLTTLTSGKIDDFVWVQNVHKCLGEQDVDTGTQRKKKSMIDSHIIGLLSGISALVIVCVYIIARGKARMNATAHEDGKSDMSGTKRHLPKESRYLKVPVKEIYDATNNLDQLNYIGEGTAGDIFSRVWPIRVQIHSEPPKWWGHESCLTIALLQENGKVYRGKLSNKQHVAVKHIINDGFVETFLREVRNLALVRHPNLVALLGYCDNGDECFLIYELCTNGNLSEWLFGKYEVLSWIQRLEIAVDCARGLWFLHTYPQGCIVHRDVKPTNILLGPNCEAKLSDFGLSKVIDIGKTHASSEVRGTFGYVDPEYQSDCQVNSAGDVYSFGIVLLQILSGRKVINMNANKPMPLERMAKSLTKGGSIVGFADPKLEGEYSAEAFELTFELALSCTGNKQERPSMSQVVERLEKAHEVSVRGMATYLHTT